MALDFDEDIDWDGIFCTRDTEDASEVIPTDSDSDLDPNDVDYNLRDIKSGREDPEEVGLLFSFRGHNYYKKISNARGKMLLGLSDRS